MLWELTHYRFEKSLVLPAAPSAYYHLRRLFPDGMMGFLKFCC